MSKLNRTTIIHLEAIKIILEWKEKVISSNDIGKGLKLSDTKLGGLISSLVRDKSLEKALIIDVGSKNRVMQYVINPELTAGDKSSLLQEVNKELERRRKLLE